ncbi:imm11 family protein [Stenotrophomonas riyadhensis]|uniref:imm11 family protein n=1 Tax=Stenotrophomonas riyadhensis TaxID=2859893 RepID=UPI002FFAB54D
MLWIRVSCPVAIVSARFRSALEGPPEVDGLHANAAMEPVVIEGQRTRGSYFVLIVETCVDCVGESRSEFGRFERDDAVRPDLAGQYRAFAKLALGGGKVGSWHIFRIGGFGAALIVSGEVKSRLEWAGVTDVIFEQVG